MTHAEERRAIRLLKAVNRYSDKIPVKKQLVALARELDEPDADPEHEHARIVGAVALGDPRKLRGLPMIAHGISGTQAGTDPLRAVLAAERRRA